MPTFEQHIAKARRLKAALERQNPQDWEVIAMTRHLLALHLVDAQFARHDEHPEDHRERNNLLDYRHRALGIPWLAYQCYLQLLKLCHEARYKAPSEGRFRIVLEQMEQDLQDLSSEMQPVLGLEL